MVVSGTHTQRWPLNRPSATLQRSSHNFEQKLELHCGNQQHPGQSWGYRPSSTGRQRENECKSEGWCKLILAKAATPGNNTNDCCEPPQFLTHLHAVPGPSKSHLSLGHFFHINISVLFFNHVILIWGGIFIRVAHVLSFLSRAATKTETFS